MRRSMFSRSGYRNCFSEHMIHSLGSTLHTFNKRNWSRRLDQTMSRIRNWFSMVPIRLMQWTALHVPVSRWGIYISSGRNNATLHNMTLRCTNMYGPDHVFLTVSGRHCETRSQRYASIHSWQDTNAADFILLEFLHVITSVEVIDYIIDFEVHEMWS